MNARIPWIVAAACRNKNTGVIAVGARHFDEVMRKQIEAMASSDDEKTSLAHRRNEWSQADQGFIDQFGTFHDRIQALEIAQANHQCFRNQAASNKLYSEDLY